MGLRICQFLAIMFTAIALVPVGAHVLSLLAKIELPEQPYFTAQQIYRGWAWLGVAIAAAILANLASALLVRGQPRPFGLSLAACLLIVGTLVVFFVWTYPTNQATGNWTDAPDNWEQLRAQWEYSHAANAVITFAALVCSVLAPLSTSMVQTVAARTVVTPPTGKNT
ncbi:MAG TPA: hypothetical protein VFG64_12125 [Dongiaceae bacterium]|nr:hypothetical protein [Dongiaceae bacterium]